MNVCAFPGDLRNNAHILEFLDVGKETRVGRPGTEGLSGMCGVEGLAEETRIQRPSKSFFQLWEQAENLRIVNGGAGNVIYCTIV